MLPNLTNNDVITQACQIYFLKRFLLYAIYAWCQVWHSDVHRLQSDPICVGRLTKQLNSDYEFAQRKKWGFKQLQNWFLGKHWYLAVLLKHIDNEETVTQSVVVVMQGLCKYLPTLDRWKEWCAVRTTCHSHHLWKWPVMCCGMENPMYLTQLHNK